jgi:hypothetical protein
MLGSFLYLAYDRIKHEMNFHVAFLGSLMIAISICLPVFLLGMITFVEFLILCGNVRDGFQHDFQT